MQFQDLILNAPRQSGVYQFFDQNGVLLYVGKAKDLSARLHQYADPARLNPRLALLVSQVAKVEIKITPTEIDALLLEANFIKHKRPKFNILLSDDKMYPMLSLTKSDFPRLLKFRAKVVGGRDTFGPYPSVSALHDTIKLVQQTAMLRTCTDAEMKNRARPCILYQIKRCGAPCCGKISREDYANDVKMARQTLSGNSTELAKGLNAKMQAASETQDFEKAAALRDQLKSLQTTAQAGRMNTRNADYFVMENGAVGIAKLRGGAWTYSQIIRPKQTGDMTESEILGAAILQFYDGEKVDADIITNIQTAPEISDALDAKIITKTDDHTNLICAQISADEKFFAAKIKKWAEPIAELEKWLDIKLRRADVFDNSHLFGKNPVGAMIVFASEGFAKKEYRHFKLEDGSVAGNDIGMMQEFLTRRYARAKTDNSLPTLIIVDGGRAQWNAARKVLSELDLSVPVLGVVKGEVRSGDEHFIMPDGSEQKLEKGTPLFLLLGAVRDEAHRFAINFHRHSRAKSAGASVLSEIDGIGAMRRKALMSHFGSLDLIKDATAAALASAPGISKEQAEKIFLFFHPDMI
ncbi:MAG: excinuclease ABC subunit UvrC [Rickettsiales bacterium]|jgi:excinuclease ABC subunit C|nr:excinuclease ABC subunit UvrC [Rickettsiales bacterium]